MTHINTEQHALDSNLKTPNSSDHYELRESDLPAHCPQPGTSIWNSHPRVYLPIKENGGEARCPYCGALYSLKD